MRAIITALIGAAAGALPAAAAAHPQRPVSRVATHERNGRIAFQANVGRLPQVFTIEPDGSGLRQVTHVPSHDPGAENPIWSPDGTTIAFDAAAGKGVNIFTLSHGTHPAPLPLSVGAFNGDPAYSADGTQISFDQDTGPSAPTVHGIFIANADGSNPRRVATGIRTTHAFDTQSQWSPDGKRLVFMSVKNGKQAAIFVVNIDGTGLKRLTPWSLDAGNPDWSPDGREILFNPYWDPHPGKFSNIFSMRPDGSHRTQLTHARPGVQSFAPAWSPDGAKIVFVRFTPIGKQNGRLDLFTMSRDGTRVRRVTNMPRAFPTNPDWGTAP
jgi:Tol biopolymer transport system component